MKRKKSPIVPVPEILPIGTGRHVNNYSVRVSELVPFCR